LRVPSLELRELAIHVVLKQLRGVPVAPKLSEALTPLDRESSHFLEGKFLEAFDEANDIVRMDDPVSPVPSLIQQFHAGQLSLLDMSQLIAERLQEVQSGVTSDGLLLVGRATRERDRLLVIAKMEHERGARAEPRTDELGRSVYQIEVLNDLFLTSKTRVFKVAVFDDRCADIGNFRGRLSDSQSPGRQLADYFLHDFLGCERARRAEVITQDFFRTVSRKSRGMQPNERAKVYVAMVTDLSSNSRRVNVRDFAMNHLPVDMRDDFLQSVHDAGVPQVFVKDNSLIEGELNSIQIDFENGSILYSLPEEIGNSVVIGNDQTEVRSRPATVGPARKRLSQADRFPEVRQLRPQQSDRT
jgi:hypothetical protein